MEYSLAVVFQIISYRDSNRVPFSCVQVGEQPKIASSHVGRVGSLSNHRNVVWPRKFESVARNELVRCHDAAAMFPLPTGLDSCTAQHCEGDEGLPDSILC